MSQLRDDATGPVRLRLAIALAAVVPLGLALKFSYHGPGATWAANHAAGILYEIFWVAAVCLVFPRLSLWRVATGVFAATCLLELLQLCRAPLARVDQEYPPRRHAAWGFLRLVGLPALCRGLRNGLGRGRVVHEGRPAPVKQTLGRGARS